MCGIVGIVELGGVGGPAPERVAAVERMLELVGHRGPDEAGTFVDERVALGAVRLRILDLERGQQPVGEPSGRFWIVYNGEIYNYLELREELAARGHRFATSSDTEVALRAWMEWGERAPERFEGGFAFALYDRRQRRVSLVRDRFGKRPLFYRSEGEAVVFASEMKAFLARPGAAPAWNPSHLAALFVHWTPVADETPYEGIRQVPAAGIVRLDAGGTTETTYAPSFLDVAAAGDDDLEAAATACRAALSRAVRIRLRSDVEVGVLASGGLDSSIVARLVRDQRPGPLRAFSIRFRDARFDESAYQEQVARALDLRLHSIEVSADDIAAAFRDALWHAEIPQFRTAFVPMFLLARTIAGHGIKVVLSGEGADESFLGYDIFKETRLRAEWPALDRERRRDAIRRLYPYLEHFADANVSALEAWFGRWGGDPSDPLFSHQPRFDNGRFAARLLAGGPSEGDRLRQALASDPSARGLSPVRRAQWLELHTLLQGYLLSSQGDRMTFAHGVESRCPFLSPAVVRLAASLPESHLLSPEGEEKRLLKHVFRDDLPAAILERPKQPYRSPDAESFFAADGGGRFRPWVEELLDASELRRVAPLDPEPAGRLVAKLRRTPAGQVSPRDAQAFVLLLSLVALDRQFVRRADAPPTLVRPPLLRRVDLTSDDGRRLDAAAGSRPR